MKVSEIGEFALIERIRGIVGEPGEGETWIGDDAAVLRAPAGTIFMSADLLIQGVHFDLSLTGPKDLGYKAIAVNASDIAAMGGTPRRATVSIGLRPSTEVEWIEELYRGMRECCDETGMAIVGGDISRSDCFVISVALIGNPAGRRVITRSGAKVGDAICVTGVLGRSAAGYRLLRSGRVEPAEIVGAHLRPRARVKEAEALRRMLPSAMIDVSDGFAADLHHICSSSGVGAWVDAAQLPIVETSALDLDRSAMELALYGGEDHELCFTLPPERVNDAVVAVRAATSTKVTVVGEIRDAASGVMLFDEGQTTELEGTGWDHLKS